MIIDYLNFQNVLRQLRSPKHRRTGASAEHVLRSGVRRQSPSGLRPATRCHVLHQSASSGEPVGARPGGEDWQQDGYLFELLEGTSGVVPMDVDSLMKVVGAFLPWPKRRRKRERIWWREVKSQV